MRIEGVRKVVTMESPRSSEEGNANSWNRNMRAQGSCLEQALGRSSDVPQARTIISYSEMGFPMGSRRGIWTGMGFCLNGNLGGLEGFGGWALHCELGAGYELRGHVPGSFWGIILDPAASRVWQAQVRDARAVGPVLTHPRESSTIFVERMPVWLVPIVGGDAWAMILSSWARDSNRLRRLYRQPFSLPEDDMPLE